MTNAQDDMDRMSQDLGEIREMVNTELDGLESSFLRMDEMLEMVDGRSKENAIVIRSVMRRLDRSIRAIVKRIDAIETKIKG